MNELAILVPVLRRPHRVEPLLKSIAATTPTARVLFLTDPDDGDEQEAIRDARRWSALDVTMLAEGGNYAQKINSGVRATVEPLLFLGADDLEFHPGWLTWAKRGLAHGGVVGTNDLCSGRVQRGDHATHCLVTREYTALGTIDNPDLLLHEEYEHEFVDDEFVATAKYRGQWSFARRAVVEHLHPMVGKAPTDDLYDQQPRRMIVGRRIFRKRRHLWTN